MHPMPKLSDAQYERLKKARKSGKYGHLETWQELYLFQRTIATKEQIKEIGKYAKAKAKLPLAKKIVELL